MFITNSLKNKLILLQTITAAFSVALCSLLITASYYSISKNNERNTLENTARLLGNNLAIAYSYGDSYSDELTENLSTFKSDSSVLSACIYELSKTNKTRVFAAYYRDSVRNKLPKTVPIFPNDFHIAVVNDTIHAYYRLKAERNLEESNGFLYIQKKSYSTVLFSDLMFVAILVTFISILLGVISGLFLQSTVSKPISSLINTMQTVTERQDYAMRMDEIGDEELQRLAQVFNDMLLQIEGRDRSLQEAQQELESRVTERTQELRDKTLALQLSNNELQQFAYIASHDMQEPLRIIGSFSQIIAKRYKNTIDADLNEYILFIVDAVSRMQTLIKDLLAFSRVGTVKMQPQEILLTNLLLKCRSNLRFAIEESSAQINDPTDKNMTIYADESKTLQLFQNLVGNAIKFRRPNTQPIISINVEQNDHYWTFSVTDNGIGIDKIYAEKVFMIFQRLSTAYTGTGIGLAICKKVVELHGGEIWFDSDEQKGTTFTFTVKKNLELTA